MSTRAAAFLRAVNVGGRVVSMDKLRKIFESARLKNVATVIASGNVVFDAPAGEADALEGRIERALHKSLGYEVGTFVRSLDDLAEIAAHEPFGSQEQLKGHAVFVTFLKARPDAAQRKQFAAFNGPDDELATNGRELYWFRRGGRMSDSPIWAPLGKLIGSDGTTRNVTTVRKIVAKHAKA